RAVRGTRSDEGSSHQPSSQITRRDAEPRDIATEKGRSESMKPKLVIADDEADIRRLIVFLLRSYDLYEAQNGRRALELIREVQPDLVLLDIMMPEMTGLEVLQA